MIHISELIKCVLQRIVEKILVIYFSEIKFLSTYKNKEYKISKTCKFKKNNLLLKVLGKIYSVKNRDTREIF